MGTRWSQTIELSYMGTYAQKELSCQVFLKYAREKVAEYRTKRNKLRQLDQHALAEECNAAAWALIQAVGDLVGEQAQWELELTALTAGQPRLTVLEGGAGKKKKKKKKV